MGSELPPRATDETEEQLVQRAAAGETAALELFLLQHRRGLLRYLERRIPPELRRLLEPQDVLQDVYFEVFRNIGSFKSNEPGMAVRWLLRIARNRVIDLVRMQQAEKRGSGRAMGLEGEVGNDDDSMIALLQNLAIHERTPSQSAVVHELTATLGRCIGRLPEDYRMAIRSRYLEGLDVAQTAQRMGRTPGAVMMLCNRALKALRLELRSFSRYI
jgi:RNA polymerase sigma-70 factor, ECF subfamily